MQEPKPPYCILVVDDNDDNRSLLQLVLETEGYQVKLATSGRAALAQVRASPPALILLDVMMPEMSGFEVTQRLRQQEDLAWLPIVLITAAQEVNLEQALSMGATDVLHKPLEIEELLTRVSTWCQMPLKAKE